MENNNKAKILLPDDIFTLDLSNTIVTCSIEMQKQPIHDNAQMHNSDSAESIIRKLQHKREKYITKGLPKEDSQ